MRECGDCQLCCKLLPVPPLGKPGGVRCKFQRHRKGCSVYHTPRMPPACGLWNCRWLVNNDCAELSRPDRAHYVLDIAPDYVTVRDGENGTPINIQVAQVWCDPDFPEAHRDPALRRWMFRRAQEGIATLVRFNSRDALTIFPPPFDNKGEWHEKRGGTAEREHSIADVEAALGGEARVVIEP
jgi:hypothetical protein